MPVLQVNTGFITKYVILVTTCIKLYTHDSLKTVNTLPVNTLLGKSLPVNTLPNENFWQIVTWQNCQLAK